MDNYEENFKGIWIPRNIIEDCNMSYLGRIIYSQIHEYEDYELAYELDEGNLKKYLCEITSCSGEEFDEEIEELKDILYILRSYNKEFQDHLKETGYGSK